LLLLRVVKVVERQQQQLLAVGVEEFQPKLILIRIIQGLLFNNK
jgi:hypothetical protein